MRAPKLGPLQRLACLAGNHRRDRKRVRQVAIDARHFYAAPCAGCGAMMSKERGEWQLLNADDSSALTTDRRMVVVAKEGLEPPTPGL